MVKKYWLRNVSKCDINLGDLRYKIPIGQCRNLLSSSAKLKLSDVKKSIRSGSVRARLQKGTLMEVQHNIVLDPPPKREATSNSIIFPKQRRVVVSRDVSKLDDKLDDMILNEEDDLLKELEEEDRIMNEMSDVPIVAKKRTKDGS